MERKDFRVPVVCARRARACRARNETAERNPTALVETSVAEIAPPLLASRFSIDEPGSKSTLPPLPGPTGRSSELLSGGEKLARCLAAETVGLRVHPCRARGIQTLGWEQNRSRPFL